MTHSRPAMRPMPVTTDRKSTRLNSSHDQISYAVFCLKKKKNTHRQEQVGYNRRLRLSPSRKGSHFRGRHPAHPQADRDETPRPALVKQDYDTELPSS